MSAGDQNYSRIAQLNVDPIRRHRYPAFVGKFR